MILKEKQEEQNTTKEDEKDLKKFLKGIHMGGSTFESYLNKAEDPELKNALKVIIESFKRHEEAITHRIEKMGGNAPDTLGLMGTISELFQKIKLLPVDSDLEICEQAVQAMEMGLYQGKKFIEENQDLDPSLLNEVKGVVKDYDNQLIRMKQIKGKFEK